MNSETKGFYPLLTIDNKTTRTSLMNYDAIENRALVTYDWLTTLLFAELVTSSQAKVFQRKC